MLDPLAVVRFVLAAVAVLALVSAQQVPEPALRTAPAHLRDGQLSERRAIRRDIPLTRSIRRAFAAGTRDFTGRPGQNYWQLETDFTIHARLDRENHAIVGSETIVVHNNSPDPLLRIVLRLDHNLFRARQQRGSSVPAELTDGMVVKRLAVNGTEVDLTARPRRGRGAADQITVGGLESTVAAVRLVDPVAPGAKVTLAIDWSTRLPGGSGGRGHRMTQRWEDRVYQPTQWFPRLAKYDDLNGWDTSPYLGPAEFYNNFGRFDVRIDVPAGWLVSATGVLQNAAEVLAPAVRERLGTVLDSDAEVAIVAPGERGAGTATAAGGRLVWRFVADKVNDFAWATSAEYEWRATRATIPGKGPVPIHMLFLPERARRYARAGEVTRHALEFYSEKFGAYPFPQITLQDGPSSGMEYPMVLNSNQGAADHEAAHQWWPMMVGTDETTYGWMDEGFNVYMNAWSGAHRRGRAASFDGRGALYGQRAGDESEPPMMWDANYAGPQYGFQTYMKTSLMLSMLGGIVGDEAVQQVMKEYAETWAFKHPSPWDFAFFVSSELERDLGWFFYYWLFTTDAVDGSIQDVARDGDDTIVTVHQAGQMPSPVVLRVEFATDGPAIQPMGNARLVEDNVAIVTWPVDVWFDGDRKFAARLTFGGRAIEKITLDPFGRFPDATKDDNVWPR